MLVRCARQSGDLVTRHAPRSRAALALVTIVCILAACSATEHGTKGYPTGRFQRTVKVWLDKDGPYTCPPGGPITKSDPPQCAAPAKDRVRLQNKPIWTFVAATGRFPNERVSQFIGVASVTGRSTDRGFTVKTEQVRAR